MIVQPKDPDVAFAAVLGHAFGPNPERGGHRNCDGGKTWPATRRTVQRAAPGGGAVHTIAMRSPTMECARAGELRKTIAS